MSFIVPSLTGANARDQWFEVKSQWNGQWKTSVWKKAEINQGKLSQWQKFVNSLTYLWSIIQVLNSIDDKEGILQVNEISPQAGDFLEFEHYYSEFLKIGALTNLVKHNLLFLLVNLTSFINRYYFLGYLGLSFSICGFFHTSVSLPVFNGQTF